MYRYRRITFIVLLSILALLISGVSPVQAGDPPPPQAPQQAMEKFWQGTFKQPAKTLSLGLGREHFSTLRRALLAKAQPDECFTGIGGPYNPDPTCAGVEGGVPKVNQAYVWGLAEAGDNLWFGTAPNVHCLVFGTFMNITLPHQTDSWVCEFGESPFSPPLPDQVGDWRMARVYQYNAVSKELVEKTPADDPLFQATLGLRSAGSLNDVVLLAGPSLTGGINLFAFNNADGAYLGSTNLPEYNNIRKWSVIQGVLYTTVGRTGGGGAVLRWNGSPADPFLVEEVGIIDGEGAELALHQGRIFISTWPSTAGGTRALAGLWMSPLLPEGGLTPAEAAGWQKVWDYGMYDPDPVTAAVTGGGALASYGGYLYWGTMHVPFLAGIAHLRTYGTPETEEEIIETLLGGHRAISLFRGKNFGAENQRIQLLYGERELPTYVPGEGWVKLPNKMNTRPLYGHSGFGNPFNNYTWTMSVYRNQLFVGTMDWSYLFSEGLKTVLETQANLPLSRVPAMPVQTFGADLWRFPAVFMPALPESVNGVGNYSNYGIRTMLNADGALYLGTANPMNLMTDPNDGRPEGGWELLKLWR